MWIFLKGKLLIKYLNKNGKLTKKIVKKGGVFHFPPGFLHQEEAITDCEIIKHPVHILMTESEWKKYGLKIKGLPTTSRKEIIFK